MYGVSEPIWRKELVDMNVPLVQGPTGQSACLCPSESLQHRIGQLGLKQVLEDQTAALCTYHWQLLKGGRVSSKHIKGEIVRIQSFLASCGNWTLADGTVRPITIWDLASPGGMAIVHTWLEQLGDTDERVFADMYGAVRRFFEQFMCQPGMILDYRCAVKVGRRTPPSQNGMVVLSDRYGPLENPCPITLQPRQRRPPQEPVPDLEQEWLQVLDVLWFRLKRCDGMTVRNGFPLARVINMIHLHTAIGARPSELCLIKQGHLQADKVVILHGGEKDKRGKRRAAYDIYGNRLKRHRQTPLRFVPDGLVSRVHTWPESLAMARVIEMEEERALFPRTPGQGSENCIGYNAYRGDFKALLLDIAREPSVRHILSPYISRPSRDKERRTIRLTPHTLRSIYVTHRMRNVDGPDAFLELMDHVGWTCLETAKIYFRPKRKLDPKRIQDVTFRALRRGRAA
jgi:integrase